MAVSKNAIQPGDALLIVDVQNDFCPGGALPIPDGDAVVPILNEWIDAAQAQGIPIYASRDWHPPGHISFKEKGGRWPPHCLQDTHGAAFHPALRLPDHAIKVTKGVRFDQDQNSAFDQTGLLEEFRRARVRRVWIGGLAQDVCVLASALDARQAGFAVFLIAEATRPVTPEGGSTSLRQMCDVGITILPG
jgi:nicotinamidase/pyrazinamidase